VAWGEMKVEDKRKEFIGKCKEEIQNFSDLCRQYKISRPTGYKWIERFEEEGIEGLENRSRAPLHQASGTECSLVKQILRVRLQWRDWGPKKVLGYLKIHFPDTMWPSTTTIGNIFDRNGLTVCRKYRRRVPARTTPLAHSQQPNDVWCADFKGWFLTKDGQKCEPFTLTDASSRFLIRCKKLDFNKGEYVWGVLDAAFREWGLPLYLRHDNGPPFATCAPGRLSQLSIKLIKAGVIPEWIEPGKPQQNGRHERMHLTLKNETATPPADNLKLQQIRLEKFQDYYNFIRPHEALNQNTPGSAYCPSPRKWDGHLRAPEYPDGYEVRKVMKSGSIARRGKNLFISEILYKEYVGIVEQEDGHFTVSYGPIILGSIDQSNTFQIPQNKRRRAKRG
jgi:putative transposase